jgi:hypothetical protein
VRLAAVLDFGACRVGLYLENVFRS